MKAKENTKAEMVESEEEERNKKLMWICLGGHGDNHFLKLSPFLDIKNLSTTAVHPAIQSTLHVSLLTSFSCHISAVTIYYSFP